VGIFTLAAMPFLIFQNKVHLKIFGALSESLLELFRGVLLF
jgi:hypothetical protein